MKAGARRKTITSDLPQPPPPDQNDTDNQVSDQLQLGKRSRKNDRQQMNAGENGGNAYDDDENEGYEEDDGQNNGDEERPKLAEGFFEIEALRRARIRKGVKQYLIKWRGYPESANTWEPVESFASCPDVIEAFESMNSGKRKRKRKHSAGYISQSKNKQQDSPDAACPMPSVRIKDTEQPCSGSHVHNLNATENKSNEFEGKPNEIKDTSSMNQDNMTQFLIHIQEDPVEPANGVLKVDETKVCRASPRLGARRRKACAVKRFKNESNSAPRKDANKNTTAASDVIKQDDIKNADVMVNSLDSENISIPVITKIVKPVNYSISVLNDIEEVCVSFLVRRADGEEIVVDNKYLKENNPVLLINFYEQHLRYNCPTE
ncbi:hypothetical protein E3N88_32401 [Mikania micrantha]|uniref:Chromo domain-containing protein n=1 Tax=Mikania micrantha TaxID=192012 RepID=A0A5N6M8Y1_9ASTR|nr:hypothetical protein E3N88_32401 [Mikania micrantha]